MVMKDEIDFEISEFYRSRTFGKVENMMNILKFFKIFENIKIRNKKIRKKGKMRGAPALRVIRAETRLTVYRSLP